MTTCEIAIKCLEKGLSVIPLYSSSTDEIDMPCINNWQKHQYRLPKKGDVAKWFTKNPLANIGVIFGPVSKIIFFCMDSKDAAAYSKDRGSFPDTIRVNIGNDQPLYMRHPGFCVNKLYEADWILKYVDGCTYAIAPTSLLASDIKCEGKEEAAQQEKGGAE